MQPIGLYLHIPFCVQKCAYCSFASYAGQEARWRPVLEAMKAEMRRAEASPGGEPSCAPISGWRRGEGIRVGTIYVGGGTPTVWPVDMLAELLGAASAFFEVEPDAEISMEANPGTIDGRKLEALREAGVNRLSLGAQTMQPQLLEAIGRIHRWEAVEDAVRLARAAGFENINLDLMYGLPGQTPRMFRDTLEAALSLAPEHLSIYCLTIEEGTPLFARHQEAPEAFPSEEALEEMSDDALWMCEDAGLARYEISNYAKPGRMSRHNLGYWLRRDYLGIGCAAHSLMCNHRWANASTIGEYLLGKREDESVIPENEARFERMMLGLRLVDGIPWEEQALFDQFKEKLQKLRERGLVEWNEERVWLTKRGLDLQNRVIVELMD